MFYVYIIYSASSDKFYVGHTDNVRHRVIEHNTSERKTFTSKHRPWELKVYFEAGESRGDAMKIEKSIKNLKSRMLIENIVNGIFLPEFLAQLVRVPTGRD